MEFKAIECKTPHEAIELAEASDANAIRMDGRNLVVSQVETDRLMDAGLPFAYLADHNGTIVTIPVNE